MSPPRAKTFADRLVPVVAHEEEDVSALSDEMVDAVYPGRVVRPFRMGLRFETFGGTNYQRAVEIARRSPAYREVSLGETVEHQATFDAAHAQDFYELYRIVRLIPSHEVVVNGRKLRTGRTIWPLFFGILGGEWAWEPLAPGEVGTVGPQ
jgi:hypothetical protein